MDHVNRSSFVRDCAVATALLASLYGLAYGVHVQPVQIPGYLLIVGFGVLEAGLGSEAAASPAVFAAYLVALGVVGAAAVRIVRRRVSEDHRSGWRIGVASALGVTGVLSLLFAVGVFFGTSQTEPVAITGVFGLLLLGLASWFAGLFEVSTNWT